MSNNFLFAEEHILNGNDPVPSQHTDETLISSNVKGKFCPSHASCDTSTSRQYARY